MVLLSAHLLSGDQSNVTGEIALGPLPLEGGAGGLGDDHGIRASAEHLQDLPHSGKRRKAVHDVRDLGIHGEGPFEDRAQGGIAASLDLRAKRGERVLGLPGHPAIEFLGAGH